MSKSGDDRESSTITLPEGFDRTEPLKLMILSGPAPYALGLPFVEEGRDEPKYEFCSFVTGQQLGAYLDRICDAVEKEKKS